ncbi:MAG: hypothetical protein ABSG01_03820 [Anaerolineales bacterium]
MDILCRYIGACLRVVWGDGENALAELLECRARIRDAAHQVIAWIDEQYAEVVPVDGVSTLTLQAEAEFVPT